MMTVLHESAAGISDQDLATQLEGSHQLIDVLDAFGYTPLMWAARRRDYKAINLLLEWGADVNLQNNWGYTALHFAASHSSSECVQILLDAGASVGTITHWENSPLGLAVYYNAPPEIVALLLMQGSDVNSALPWTSILHVAVARGNEDLASKLLDYGADIDSLDGSGRSPLFRAVHKDNTELTKQLLDIGAKYDTTDLGGRGILHWIACCGSIDTMKMVANRKLLALDVEAKDKDGCTPWDYFQSKRRGYLHEGREPLEAEEAVFRTLLNSVVRSPVDG